MRAATALRGSSRVRTVEEYLPHSVTMPTRKPHSVITQSPAAIFFLSHKLPLSTEDILTANPLTCLYYPIIIGTQYITSALKIKYFLKIIHK